MENSMWIVVAALAGALAGAALWWAMLRRRTGDEISKTAERLMAAQAELSGRLSQMAESGAASQARLAERMQAQERALSKTLEERLGDVSRRLGDSLQKSGLQTAETMTGLKERLAVIDAAQKNITALSAQVVELQDILTNRQARGAFGEIQLNDLVRDTLPPSAYEFQATLGNGRRADCLLKLPNPPGAIVVDAKFPLESYRALREASDDAGRTQAGRAFQAAVMKHVKDIAERYIVPGETAESALMFLPSEAVYAELHAGFPDTVERSHRARVWIVSPTTLMATLNTIRAVLKDANMREQAGVIQAEVSRLLSDVGRLDDRVAKLQRHFEQSGEDVRQIRISTDKITRRGEAIEEIHVGEDAPAEDLPGGATVHQIGAGE